MGCQPAPADQLAYSAPWSGEGANTTTNVFSARQLVLAGGIDVLIADGTFKCSGKLKPEYLCENSPELQFLKS